MIFNSVTSSKSSSSSGSISTYGSRVCQISNLEIDLIGEGNYATYSRDQVMW